MGRNESDIFFIWYVISVALLVEHIQLVMI